MKMHEITAKDIRTGLKQIKQQCGDDAIIVSTTETADGLVFAVGTDYNQQLVASSDTHSMVSDPIADAAEPVPAGSAAQTLDALTTELQQTKARMEKERQQIQQVLHRQVSQVEQQRALIKDQQRIINEHEKRQSTLQASITHHQQQARAARHGIQELKQQAAKANQNLTDKAITTVYQEVARLRQTLQMQVAFSGWQQWLKKNPAPISVLKRFESMGFTSSYVASLLKKLPKNLSSRSALKFALHSMAHELKLDRSAPLQPGQSLALVGPTGVGKTTTIAKLAGQLLNQGYQHHDILLISTDRQRLQAYEQLQALGRSMQLMVVEASDAQQLNNVISTFGQQRICLIDTAGMNPNDVNYNQLLQYFSQQDIRVYLTLSANAHAEHLADVLQYYQHVPVERCILTKLDEVHCLGPALSQIIQAGISLSYVTNGQSIPEDLSIPDKTALLKQALQSSKKQPITAQVMARYQDLVMSE